MTATPEQVREHHEREAREAESEASGGDDWLPASYWEARAAFHRDAASVIARLEEENRRYREALEDIATRRNIDRIDCSALARRALSESLVESSASERGEQT